MGWFKKDKKEEVGLPDLPEEEDYSLPELPEFPNKNKTKNPYLKDKDMNQEQIKKEVSSNFQKSNIPNPPSNFQKSKFSNEMSHQDSFQKSNIPNPPSNFQKSKFSNEMSHQDSFQKSNFPPLNQENKRLESHFQNKTKEMPFIEKKSVSKSYSKEAKPVYIRLDKFNETLKTFEDIKYKIKEIENLLQKTKEIKTKEEQELAEWEREIQIIKTRIDGIDKNIFDRIE